MRLKSSKLLVNGRCSQDGAPGDPLESSTDSFGAWAESRTLSSSRHVEAVKRAAAPRPVRKIVGFDGEKSDVTTTRIWLASQTFVPVRGGATLRFQRYFPGLRKLGIQTSVLTGTVKGAKILPSDRDSDWYRLAPGSPIARTELPDGTPLWGVRLIDELSRARQDIYFRWLRREFDAADERPELLAFALALSTKTERRVLEATRLDVPTVYLFTLTNKLPPNPLLAWWKKRSLARQYQSFDCIIVATDAHEVWLRGLGVTTRIEVIPNGVDTVRFRPVESRDEKEALRKELGFTADQQISLIVGAVSPRKGTDLAVEAWTQIARERPHAQLVVLGHRADLNDPRLASFAARLQELLADPAIQGRVHMRGTVANPEAYYRAADALLLPTEREGGLNALLEAMASGIPAVITRFVGLGDAFGEAGMHYVLADRTPEALSAALADALAEPHCRDLGREGRRWVVDRLGVGKSLDRFAAVFHDLAHPSAPATAASRDRG